MSAAKQPRQQSKGYAERLSGNLKPTPPQAVTRTVITLPPGQQLAGLENGVAVALSPDGTHLAYVALQGGTPVSAVWS